MTLRLDVLAVCLTMASSPAIASISPYLAGPVVAIAFLIATYRWIRYRIGRTRRRDDPKFEASWPLLASAVLIAPMLATFGALQLLFGTLYVDLLSMTVVGLAVGLLSSLAFSGLVGRVFGEGAPRTRIVATQRRVSRG